MIRYYARHIDESEKRRRWVDPRLDFVRPADLCAYLRHKGWKEAPSDRPGFLVFEEPTIGEDGPLYQFVPEQEWEGFKAQVDDLLAAVAVIENRYAGDVLTDVLKIRSSANGPGAPATAEPAAR